MINVFNLVILIGLMIPNIIYAISVKDIKAVKKKREDKSAERSFDGSESKERSLQGETPAKERTALEELLYAEDEDDWQVTGNGVVSADAEGESIVWKDRSEEAAIRREKAAAAERAKDAKKKARLKRLDVLVGIAESVGRYACMILMIVPFGVLEFGFSCVENFIIYTFGNIVLMLAYWIVWSFFLKKKTFKRAVALAILPTMIFLLTGLTLDHWWLALAALLFGVCHTGITLESEWEE